MIRFHLNGKPVQCQGHPDKPLLWVLREEFSLSGAKYNCGMGLCGSCTVQLDQAVIRACITPMKMVENRTVTTIEGLPPNHPLWRAWSKQEVPQCGYCQSGQIMAADALLRNNADPDDTAIDAAMAGNLCRCGTYPRIRQAIKLASRLGKQEP